MIACAFHISRTMPRTHTPHATHGDMHLREKKNIFSSTFTDDKNGNDVSTTTTKGQGAECKSATLPMVYRGTMSLLNDTVWFAFLAMPYVTFLIGFTLSGSLMRGISIEFDVEDYPYVE